MQDLARWMRHVDINAMSRDPRVAERMATDAMMLLMDRGLSPDAMEWIFKAMFMARLVEQGAI